LSTVYGSAKPSPHDPAFQTTAINPKDSAFHIPGTMPKPVLASEGLGATEEPNSGRHTWAIVESGGWWYTEKEPSRFSWEIVGIDFIFPLGFSTGFDLHGDWGATNDSVATCDEFEGSSSCGMDVYEGNLVGADFRVGWSKRFASLSWLGLRTLTGISVDHYHEEDNICSNCPSPTHILSSIFLSPELILFSPMENGMAVFVAIGPRWDFGTRSANTGHGIGLQLGMATPPLQ
jgi:hypothetical protein